MISSGCISQGDVGDGERMTTATLDKPLCPKCGSASVLYRAYDQTFVCHRCGHRWKKEAK